MWLLFVLLILLLLFIYIYIQVLLNTVCLIITDLKIANSCYQMAIWVWFFESEPSAQWRDNKVTIIDPHLYSFLALSYICLGYTNHIYIYVYVCTYVYIYIYTYTYTYSIIIQLYTHVNVYTYITTCNPHRNPLIQTQCPTNHSLGDCWLYPEISRPYPHSSTTPPGHILTYHE